MSTVMNVSACICGLFSGFLLTRGGFGTFPLMVLFWCILAEMFAALSATPVITAITFNISSAISFWVLKVLFARHDLRGSPTIMEDFVFLVILVLAAVFASQISWGVVWLRKLR